MGAKRTLPVAVLRAECEFFARSICALTGGELPDEVAATRPGGSGNPERGPTGWLVHYRSLVAEHARRTQRATAGTPADAVGLAILAERPLTRTSLVPGEDGGPRRLTVYPKSYETLRHMAARDAQLGFLLPLQQLLLVDPDAVPSEAGALAAGILDEHRLLAWIAMHPGVGIPWDPTAEPPAELPAHVLDLRPIEIHQVRRMHEEVNHHQLMRVRELLEPGDPDQPNLSGWSAFFVGAAELLGEPERVLMRDRSLASVILRVQLKASERRKAEQAAEAKRAAGA